MAEEQAPDSIPPRVSDHLPNLASMRDHEFLELVWENGQILIRGLSSKITEKSSPSSGYFSQSSKAPIQRERETSTAKRSKDGDVDSMFGNPLSGFSGLTKLDRHEKNKKNSLQTCQELLSELYEDGFNDALVPGKECYDKQLIDSNQSYVSKLVEDIPRQTVNSNSEVPQSSFKQCEGSIQFMRSKEKKSRVDEKSGGVNFSIFLRTPALHKSNHPSSGATRPTSSPGLAGAEDLEGNARSSSRRSNPFDMTQVQRTDCSTNIRSAEKEGNFTARNMKPILPDSEPQKESLPDEQSEAVGYKDTRPPNKVHGPSSSLAPNTAINGNPGNRKSVEQMVASSSVCSREASNCPIYTLKGIPEEDTDLSENDMEEPEGTIKAAPARGRKRKRKTEVHNLSERRRRDKINKKMRALQELIPNCNKVDEASMLDEAIEYLKTLQLQVKMMSMGTGVYMPPMMLPSAMQHMNAQNLAGYSPMAVGMGMRMQMGLGCGAAQFPTSLMSGATALPGNPEARLNMLGFPGQGLLMSMSCSPFASLAGRFSPQSVQAPVVSQAAAAQVEVPGAAAPLSTSKDSNPTH